MDGVSRDTFSELYEQLKDLRFSHRAGDSLGGVRVPGASGLPETGRGAGDWSLDGHGAAGDSRSARGVSPRTAPGSPFGSRSSAIASGSKERLGGISKRGSRYVRTLLIHGARAVVQRAERRSDTQGRWLEALARRKGPNVDAVALANNSARVIWALLAHDGVSTARLGAVGSTRSSRGKPSHRPRIHTKEYSADHP